MKRTFYLMVTIALFAAGCANKDAGYKKTPDGSEYKIIANEKGKKAAAGNFLQLNILAKYKEALPGLCLTILHNYPCSLEICMKEIV